MRIVLDSNIFVLRDNATGSPNVPCHSHSRDAHKPHAFSADLAAIFDLLAKGVLRPQVTELPLEEASEAHRRLEAGETTGKLVLTIA